MNVNLKLLHHFLAVAEHGSFRRAAEEIGRSQSSVSMQVRQLELQLGVELFHRTTRNVRLTAEGELLLDSARKAIAELDIGLRRIRQASDSQRGRIALACVPAVAATRLPRALGAFKSAYPQVAVEIRELESAEMLDAIREQQVLFGIGPRAEHASGLHFHPILVDEICALVPAALRPAQEGSLALAELARLGLRIVAGSATIQRMLAQAQRGSGFDLAVEQEDWQLQTQIAMAEAGLAIIVLPRIALPATLSDKVYALPIAAPRLAREIGILVRRGQRLPRLATQFMATVQTHIANPDAGPDQPVRAGLALVG